MNSPGIYSLGALGITAALTSFALTEIDGLEGMTALSLEARFAWGSGGTSLVCVVQTQFASPNWLDIARFDFAGASAVKIANLSGLTPKAVAAYSALSSEGQNDGIFGSKLRAVLTSVGVYAGSTTLSLIANAR